MISAEKAMNTKVEELVEELIKVFNFYFGHSFIQQNGNKKVHKFYTSLTWFLKLHDSYKFCNNVS